MTNFTDTHPEGYDPIRDGGADYGYDPENDDETYDTYDDDGYSAGFNDGQDSAATFYRSFRLVRWQMDFRFWLHTQRVRLRYLRRDLSRKLHGQKDDDSDIPF